MRLFLPKEEMCFPTSVGGLDGPAIDLVEGASAPFMLR